SSSATQFSGPTAIRSWSASATCSVQGLPRAMLSFTPAAFRAAWRICICRRRSRNTSVGACGRFLGTGPSGELADISETKLLVRWTAGRRGGIEVNGPQGIYTLLIRKSLKVKSRHVSRLQHCDALSPTRACGWVRLGFTVDPDFAAY